MTPEQIERVAERKVTDYLEKIIVELAMNTSADPGSLLHGIETQAFLTCNYDDPTIEKVLYEKLQNAIKQKLAHVFQGIAQKMESKLERH